MSALLGGGPTGTWWPPKNSDAIQPPWYSFISVWQPEEIRWPRSNMRSQADFGDWLGNAPQIWDWALYTAASAATGQARNAVTGITKDHFGAVLGGVTVKLYRTASDELLDTSTSDATTGAYVLTSPYGAEAVYAVAHNTTAAGATANTLTPA